MVPNLNSSMTLSSIYTKLCTAIARQPRLNNSSSIPKISAAISTLKIMTLGRSTQNRISLEGYLSWFSSAMHTMNSGNSAVSRKFVTAYRPVFRSRRWFSAVIPLRSRFSIFCMSLSSSHIGSAGSVSKQWLYPCACSTSQYQYSTSHFLSQESPADCNRFFNLFVKNAKSQKPPPQLLCF